MIVEVHKLGSNKMVNVPEGVNNLETKVNDSNVGKLKTVSVDLKKVSHVVKKLLKTQTSC